MESLLVPSVFEEPRLQKEDHSPCLRQRRTKHSNQNRLLAALPMEEYQRLHPHLEPISLKLKEIVHVAGKPASYVYFPSKSIVSLVSLMHDGRRVEVGLVGSEGMVSTSWLIRGVRLA